MQESNPNNRFSWRDLFHECIAHWEWFLISAILCLAVAGYKLLSSNDIYESTASILIKTEDKNAISRQAHDAFNLLGLGNVGGNVHNELLTLQSPTLMAEVIEQLRLNESFKIRKGLKTVELYKQEPVVIVFENPSELPKILKMDITVKGHSEFELTNFKADGIESRETVVVKTGGPVQTPVGKLIISPSQNYSDESVGKTIHYSRIEPLLVADSYVAKLNLNMPDREATVINISYSDASVTKTLDLVSTLIETYRKNWLISQNAKTNSISELVNDRIKVTVQELNEAEVEISSFMSKNLVSDFSQASSAYFTQNLELDKEVMSYRTQVNIAKSMLNSLSESEYLTLPGNSGLTDNSIVSQIQEYNRLILEYNKLVANSGPTNSVVIDMTKSLQAIRKGVVQSLEGLITNTEIIISSLEKQKSASQKLLANTPKEVRRLANVQREQKIKEELYLFLLEKKEENDMSKSFETDNSQIIVAPHSTFIPVAPNKKLIVLAALIAAFALPIVIILLQALFDTCVHTKKDLEALKAPYLGEVTLAYGKKRRFLSARLKYYPLKYRPESNKLLVEKNSRNIINESFRVLRSRLDFMNKSGESKVFMTTSFLPGSGKTFISLNLAASYALKGCKVLVIDMDLRHASASKYLPVSKYGRGLSDFLSGSDNDYMKFIHKDVLMPGLDIIPVGTIPPNPAELILSDKLKSMIADLRKGYDCIFIDCPPMDIVADGDLIAGFADMAIFIIRAGQFEKALLSEVDELYAKKMFKNMAVVLNGVSDLGHYGYGRYGHYGYYRYGYYHHYYSKD